MEQKHRRQHEVRQYWLLHHPSELYSSGTPGYSKSPNADNAVWLGKNNGASALDFSFEGDTGSNGLSLLIEIAGFRTTNWMGWYDADFRGTFTSANRGQVWDVVFDGNDAPDNVSGSGSTTSFGTSVASAIITPSPSFGFWFLSNHSAYDMNATNVKNAADRLNGSDNRGAMFTQSDRNRIFDKTNQYFTLFAESEAALSANPAKYWVGVEDLRNGDWDYNDMVFSFSLISPVPEPGFYGVVAMGLAGLYWLRSRRRA